MNINLQNGDCLELMKDLADNSVDIIFCDPPYALGSEVIIKPDGKPEYKKAVDFMSKWEQPNGVFWEEWFYEAKRVLKHGGHCLMFGMDRQLWFNCYYANLNNFNQKQSLYWYFISNFPKASDLSKMIDKNAGAEREDTGIIDKNTEGRYKGIGGFDGAFKENTNTSRERNITAPTTHLAKKYDGFKYSIAPLKQVVETIMVFQKPYKTGSCLHDVLAMENGDETITCGGVDIEGNRCGVEKRDNPQYNGGDLLAISKGGVQNWQGKKELVTGRFPAQTYISSEASEIIDLQSGVQKSQSGGVFKKELQNITFKSTSQKPDGFSDSGGASRILHKCDFEAGDYDLYHYCPKVSKSERNEGLGGFEEKQGGSYEFRIDSSLDGKQTQKTANNHPTVKPKALLSKILKLFKKPNNQVLLDPFMGSGSMGISAVETGFDYIGFELDPDYFKISQARIENIQSKNNLILI
jgi:site-specific DNA-methyltransferase (adenine-specific)